MDQFGRTARVVLITVLLARSTPQAFIPTEDDNFLIFTVRMPEGASLHRTNAVLEQAAFILQQESAVERVNTISGFDIVSGSESPSSGLGYVVLRDRGDRGKIKEIGELIKYLSEKLSVITEVRGFNLYPRPTVPGIWRL